jgi:UDP-N-acetylglucosamine 1-carboxyvinyltransferase
MVLAGLIAEGETIITNVDYIERGYEQFIEKLQGVGSNISLYE